MKKQLLSGVAALDYKEASSPAACDKAPPSSAPLGISGLSGRGSAFTASELTGSTTTRWGRKKIHKRRNKPATTIMTMLACSILKHSCMTIEKKLSEIMPE